MGHVPEPPHSSCQPQSTLSSSDRLNSRLHETACLTFKDTEINTQSYKQGLLPLWGGDGVYVVGGGLLDDRHPFKIRGNKL